MERLSMSIAYLQVSRVKELLEEKDILDGIPNYCFGNPGHKQTSIHALYTGKLYSIGIKQNFATFI